jgi:hypothetical protein
MDNETALPHGQLQELFRNVFFVTGTMRTILLGGPWHFSRNMVVIRNGQELTLINSVRLDESGLLQLESLGTIANVVRIGSLHGIDDRFYLDRYAATLWCPEGFALGDPPIAHTPLIPGGQTPFSNCKVFKFETTKLPESILHIDQEGGILVAADALQNWESPDEFFSPESVEQMKMMNFFQRANFGPLWMQLNQPGKEDFEKLLQLPFRHVLCGHGSPLLHSAKQEYAQRAANIFAV